MTTQQHDAEALELPGAAIPLAEEIRRLPREVRYDDRSRACTAYTISHGLRNRLLTALQSTRTPDQAIPSSEGVTLADDLTRRWANDPIASPLGSKPTMLRQRDRDVIVAALRSAPPSEQNAFGDFVKGLFPASSEDVVDKVAMAIFRCNFSTDEDELTVAAKAIEWRQDFAKAERQARAALSAIPPDAAMTFAIGDRVTKRKGSSWTGRVVGTYSTALTPEGYCVESENEPGSVQVYPVAALEPAGDKPTDAAMREALRDLVTRCDGEQGVRANGSNIDTLRAHAVLGDLDDVEGEP